MSPAVLTQFAGYLEERLGADWRVNTHQEESILGRGVSVHLFIDDKVLQAARIAPGTFLQSLEPSVRALATATANRRAYRPVGPYASRATLRRKVGL